MKKKIDDEERRNRRRESVKDPFDSDYEESDDEDPYAVYGDENIGEIGVVEITEDDVRRKVAACWGLL